MCKCYKIIYIVYLPGAIDYSRLKHYVNVYITNSTLSTLTVLITQIWNELYS